MKSIFFICILFGFVYAENQLSICESVDNDTFVDNPILCGAYIYCHNGLAYPGTCPGSTVFNPASLKCELNNSICQDTFKIPIPMNKVDFGDDVLFLSNPKCCGCYFYCEGTLHENVCPGAYHFSFKNQNCDYPENVNCLYI